MSHLAICEGERTGSRKRRREAGYGPHAGLGGLGPSDAVWAKALFPNPHRELTISEARHQERGDEASQASYQHPRADHDPT